MTNNPAAGIFSILSCILGIVLGYLDLFGIGMSFDDGGYRWSHMSKMQQQGLNTAMAAFAIGITISAFLLLIGAVLLFFKKEWKLPSLFGAYISLLAWTDMLMMIFYMKYNFINNLIFLGFCAVALIPVFLVLFFLSGRFYDLQNKGKTSK